MRRKAAMSLYPAVRGFVAMILSISVTQGQYGWGVNYASTEICALKGSTVDISSTFKYPLRLSGLHTTVEQMFWFIKLKDKEPVDLRTDSQYAGRVRYHCGEKNCTLSISDLRESDSAQYKVRFITNQPGGSFTGQPGVKLSVTGLQLQRSKTSSCKIWSCTWSEMNCKSSCLPQHSSYIWYQNGKIIEKPKSNKHSDYLSSAVSLSCALKGYEDLSFPTECVPSGSCTSLTYAERRICAFKGSSVNISCTYSSKDDDGDGLEFWFRQRETTTQPEDVIREARYTSRAQLDMTKKGRSTLTIRSLTKSDSGEYRFTIGKKIDEWTNIFPGTILTVKDPDIEVQVIWSSTGPKLICHSTCLRPGPSSFVWYKNGKRIRNEIFFLFEGVIDGADNHSCAYNGYYSPSVYAPTVPKVLMSNSGDVIKDSPMSLNCSSDANPPATYSWYKTNEKLVNKEELVFRSVQPSDSGEYRCVAENDLGRMVSKAVLINVKYRPRNTSVSMSPPCEIVEGSSVTLTCSSDANPAATYTWYKGKQTLSGEQEGFLQFTSISYKDRGNYYCRTENQYGWTNSTIVYLDVQYAPKLPAVSVNPPGWIKEGISVTLICSSDANPAANYTWYKEGEDSPMASGQTFIIDNFRPEHSGSFYCEAENTRGLHKSTSCLITIAGSLKSAAITVSVIILLTLVVLAVYLRIRSSKRFKQHRQDGVTSANTEQINVGPVCNTPIDAAERQPTEPEEDCDYRPIWSIQSQAESVYSNISIITPQTEKAEEEDGLNYSVITFHHPARTRSEENGNESMTVYSTINKIM